jgi:hypothetical protein
MKKAVLLMIVFSLVSASGCTTIKKNFQRLYKKTMTIEDAIVEKERLDAADNPARKFEIETELAGRMIRVNNVKVRDVLISTDIDYSFVVVAEYQSPKGLIDLYVYSKNTSTIAAIEKSKTKISVFGDFRRFFKLIDNTWVKIDIGDADIVIEKE